MIVTGTTNAAGTTITWHRAVAVNIPDDFDVPGAYYPDEVPGNFQPPTPPPGFAWWRGWWPTYGLNSPDDLKLYVEVELDQMISRQDGPLAEFGFALGVQALKNADRYLGLHGDGDHPRRPGDEELKQAEIVEDALEAIVRYLRGKQQPHAPTSITSSNPPAPSPRKQRRSPDETEARINEYVAKIAPKLAALREDAQADRKAAINAAQALIGRNSISRATGVSLGAVSNSAIYRQLSSEFHLKRDRPALDRSRAIGLDIAIEERAMSDDDPVVEEVARREAAELIRSKLDEEDAQPLLDQLELGTLSAERVWEIAQVMLDNRDDTRTKRKTR